MLLTPILSFGERNLQQRALEKALFGKDEWFFFSPRDRKYPNGSRPNRSAGSGYWKATRKDKPNFASSRLRKIGVKKALAFFTGIPTQSIKTNWTMSEYSLPESSNRSSRQNGSMRLDDWVLCRITQKGNNSKNKPQVEENPKNKDASNSLLFKNGAINDENNPFIFNENNIRYEDIYPVDMSTSDDSYEDLDTDNLDTIMFKQL
ncbi:NAC transcription factor 56-like protein [Tanacetum coccineum]